MKKLMIVMAAIALTGVTQAASFKWANAVNQYVYQAGTTTKASGTIYLFDSAVVSQAALLDAVTGGTAISSLTSLDSQSLTSAGGFNKTSDFASIGAGDTLNAYVAIVNGDNVFVSALKSGDGQATSTTSLSFSGLSSASKAAAADWTAGASFSSAGWYKAAAVPEPTSGLLMLVGLGALALRRRRA